MQLERRHGPAASPTANQGIAARRPQPVELSHDRALPFDHRAILALQGSAGNAAVAQLMVQRRAGHLPPPKTLKADSPISVPFANRKFNQVITDVENYHAVNATDYGHQLDILVRALPPHIQAWEDENGPATAAPAGDSRQNRFRRVVNEVKKALPTEENDVRAQGVGSATLAHAADRRSLLQALDADLTTGDRRLKNSCEWIKSSGKAKLYAVTPTGDSYARLMQAEMDPAKDQAWFPRGEIGSAGDVNSPAVSYPASDLDDRTNVLLSRGSKDTEGWRTPGIIAVTSAATKEKDFLHMTLRHEVQHDADRNRDRDAQAGVRKAAELIDADTTGNRKEKAEKQLKAELTLQQYKTEYRAYSYAQRVGGPLEQIDDTVQSETLAGKIFSKRQLQIFKHLRATYPDIRAHWEHDSALTGGRHFRDAVVAYWRSDTEGVNKYNSPRVDDFWQKLDAIGDKKAKTVAEGHDDLDDDIRPVETKVSDKADIGVVALMATIAALTKEDAVYILTGSPAMLAKIASHLVGAAKVAVESELRTRSA